MSAKKDWRLEKLCSTDTLFPVPGTYSFTSDYLMQDDLSYYLVGPNLLCISTTVPSYFGYGSIALCEERQAAIKHESAFDECKPIIQIKRNFETAKY